MKGISRLDESATARQKAIITRLCMKLRIREPLEELPMTMGEAGEMIRKLIMEGKWVGVRR